MPSFTTQRAAVFKRQYFRATHTRRNADYQKALVLQRLKAHFGDSFREFLQHRNGLGLTDGQMGWNIQLLKAIEAIPSITVWQALGSGVIRVSQVEDASERRAAIRAALRASGAGRRGGTVTKHLSSQKLTGILRRYAPRFMANQQLRGPGRATHFSNQRDLLAEEIRYLITQFNGDARFRRAFGTLEEYLSDDALALLQESEAVTP